MKEGHQHKCRNNLQFKIIMLKVIIGNHNIVNIPKGNHNKDILGIILQEVEDIIMLLNLTLHSIHSVKIIHHRIHITVKGNLQSYL